MGYMHIDNLYKNDTVLMFKELYALEKIHGTSAHVSYKAGVLHFSPGGCKLETFMGIFDQEILKQRFEMLGHETIICFGEQYGGKQQGMSGTYGKEARFVVFDVKIGDTWLCVPDAADVANKLGLEFVYYKQIRALIEEVDAERDSDSVQAIRNNVGPNKMREGVVLRPLQEFVNNRGERVIAKHKRDEFRETTTPRKVGDPIQTLVGEKASLEWVTDARLAHVLDKITAPHDEKQIGNVIKAMLDDIEREGGAEVSMDKGTRRIMSSAIVTLYKKHVFNKT